MRREIAKYAKKSKEKEELGEEEMEVEEWKNSVKRRVREERQEGPREKRIKQNLKPNPLAVFFCTYVRLVFSLCCIPVFLMSVCMSVCLSANSSTKLA